MIIEINGNMFNHAPMGALVGIPVNTVGVAGRGLALYMKQRFPEAKDQYVKACRKGKIDHGELVVCDVVSYKLAMLPTKYSWTNPSDPQLIDRTVQRLLNYMIENDIQEAHIPRIGCGIGTGMLDFQTDVKPILEHYFGKDEEQKEALYIYHWG